MADPKSNPLLIAGSFVLNLDPTDLQRLRIITRRASGQQLLTDYECDMVIEELGPDVALQTLRKQVRVSRFH